MSSIPRNQWQRALCLLPRAELIAGAKTFSTPYRLQHKSLPKAGLGLLSLRDGALSESFYLGEIPVSRAHLILFDGEQQIAEGAAQVMADDLALAEALAICDAALSSHLPAAAPLHRLLTRGAQLVQQQQLQRRQMLQRTRVDFSLLSAQEINNDV